MIELPEAVTIARQMNRELKGRRIAECIRGNAPHKFAFYNIDAEAFTTRLAGKTLGGSQGRANFIHTEVEGGGTLVLGGGGERILLHPNEKTLPKKHQFLLRFEDGAYLSVTVQMWGFIQVFVEGEKSSIPCATLPGPAPISDAFTLDYFKSLFAALEPGDPRSIKYFLISKPGIAGLGNGYLHDILFRARLNPRHVAAKLFADEQELLHESIRETLQQATTMGGRDSELDLYGCPGHYVRILDTRAQGQPCPECGTKIVKESYLGGAVYYCPRCQV